MRMLFRNVRRNKWNDGVKSISAYSGLGGEVSDLNVSDPAATHEPFKLEYKIEVASFYDWSKKKADLMLPLSQISMAEANDDDDTDPLKVGSPIEYVYRLRLEFPAKYSERAPLPFSMKRDYARYEARYKVEGTVFTAERDLTTSINEVPAARHSDC